MKLRTDSVVRALLIYAALAPAAHAYVDPGTGTMLLQLGGAALAAGLFYLRGFRTWLTGLFKRDRKSGTHE